MFIHTPSSAYFPVLCWCLRCSSGCWDLWCFILVAVVGCYWTPSLWSLRNMFFVVILALGSNWGHFCVSAKTLLHFLLCLHWSVVPLHQIYYMVSFFYVRQYIVISKTSAVQVQVCNHHVRVLNTILHRKTASYCYLYKIMILMFQDKLNVDMWYPSCYSYLFSSVDALIN